jgi:hypothetical protein
VIHKIIQKALETELNYLKSMPGYEEYEKEVNDAKNNIEKFETLEIFLGFYRKQTDILFRTYIYFIFTLFFLPFLLLQFFSFFQNPVNSALLYLKNKHMLYLVSDKITFGLLFFLVCFNSSSGLWGFWMVVFGTLDDWSYFFQAV